jgi:hypothetical protein
VGRTDPGCSGAEGFTLAATRPCLRPDRCPFAGPGIPLAGCPELWQLALRALMPGDEELALEIVADVVEKLGDLT